MAVTQVSRIQVRRGLQQDLPQLASAELGWSIDTRQLYIGNGTLEEGAPVTGITEILTSQSDFTSLIGTYTFVGNAAGYTAQTGSSLLNPTVRSFQQKFDDFVNVRDFGAIGNGIDDDTAAINRALTQIYKSTVSPSEPRARRTIYFPGGTYFISDTIKVPPYARIVGDGISSSIIKLQSNSLPVVSLVDSGFNSPSVSSTVLPSFIEIQHIKIQNSDSQITQPLINLDSASNIRLQNVHLQSNVSSGYYPNLVHITSTVQSTRALTFDNCIFSNGGNGICILGSGVQSIRVVNSEFESLSNTALVLGSSNGFSSINNYFGNINLIASKAAATNTFSFAETSTADIAGGYFGNLSIGAAKGRSVSSTTTYLSTIVPGTSGTFDYEISNSSAKRFGSFQFSSYAGNVIFSDSYTEGNISINANLYANTDSLVCTLNSGTAIIQYSLKQFL